MIKTIIFDFDGVIHDTFELGFNINKQIYSNYTEEDFRRAFNGNIHENIQMSSKIDGNKFFEMQEIEFEKLIIEDEIKNELLKLRKKHDLFIISSNKESTIKKYLNRNDLKEIFVEVLGFETHTSKTEKFKILFDKYGVNIKNSIFVTDTLGDLIEANKVGIKSIAVDFGFHEVENLKKGNPIAIISSFSEIAKFVDTKS